MKQYKKITSTTFGKLGLCEVFFNDNLIGLIDIKDNLTLNIDEDWIDYTCNDTGSNIRKSKLNGVNISGGLEVIYSLENSSIFNILFTDSITEFSEQNIVLDDILGTSSKEGELKISPLEDNEFKRKDLVLYNCIIKSSNVIDLKIDGYSYINLEFISVPEVINNKYYLMKRIDYTKLLWKIDVIKPFETFYSVPSSKLLESVKLSNDLYVYSFTRESGVPLFSGFSNFIYNNNSISNKNNYVFDVVYSMTKFKEVENISNDVICVFNNVEEVKKLQFNQNGSCLEDTDVYSMVDFDNTFFTVEILYEKIFILFNNTFSSQIIVLNLSNLSLILD